MGEMILTDLPPRLYTVKEALGTPPKRARGARRDPGDYAPGNFIYLRGDRKGQLCREIKKERYRRHLLFSDGTVIVSKMSDACRPNTFEIRAARKTGEPQPVVYIINCKGLLKIGTTKQGLEKRMQQFRTENPYNIQLVATMPGGVGVEAYLHRKFKAYRKAGEWFDFRDGGHNELMDEIRALGGKRSNRWVVWRREAE